MNEGISGSTSASIDRGREAFEVASVPSDRFPMTDFTHLAIESSIISALG